MVRQAHSAPPGGPGRGWPAGLGARLGRSAQSAKAAAEKPQYGGAFSIANTYYTISPLSFDSADWAWKFNQDTGLVYEQLLAADLSKSKRNGGKHAFICRCLAAPRRHAAASWPRAGSCWTTRCGWKCNCARASCSRPSPGVMEARELVADDVVYSFERMNKSPKKIPTYFDHIAEVKATGKHTRGVHLQQLQRRVGLPLGLGLLQRHRAQGGDGGQGQGLEERQRHRPLCADQLRAGQRDDLHQEPGLLGQRDHRRPEATSCPLPTPSPTATSRTRAPP